MPVDQYPTILNVIFEKGWNTTETMYGRWDTNDGLQKLLLEDTNPYSPYQPHSYSLFSFANYNHWAGIKIEDSEVDANGVCTLSAIMPASVEWTPQDKGQVKIDYYFNFMPACIHSCPQPDIVGPSQAWLSTELDGAKLTLSAGANTSDTPRKTSRTITLIAPNATKYDTRKITFNLEIKQSGANGGGDDEPKFAAFGFGDLISERPLSVKYYTSKQLRCKDPENPTHFAVRIFGRGIINHTIWYEVPGLTNYIDVWDIKHQPNINGATQGWIQGALKQATQKVMW